MAEYSDIIVIGGGAAGLMAATYAAKAVKGITVTILEKMPRPARKLMITGKGRCNFTNLKDWNSFIPHILTKSIFLRPAFFNLPPEKVVDFFKEEGVESVIERGDRVYPASYRAVDIVDALVRAARKNGVTINENSEVTGVSFEEGLFRIVSNAQTWTCAKVIIATGGLSYPTTGCTGDGYAFAQMFGHNLTPLHPALTAIVPLGYKVVSGPSSEMKGHIDRRLEPSAAGKLLMGTQLKNINLNLYVGGQLVQTEPGDLDFTDGGLEGPTGFRVSRKCIKAIQHSQKVSISIDLKPAVEEEELFKRIQKLWTEIRSDSRSKNLSPDRMYRILLEKLLPRNLIPGFLKWNPALHNGQSRDFKLLTKALKGWKMEIAGYVGYERAVVTAGGVDTGEIVAKTMESKKQPGLYFCGELLDVDADTGGYNLQCAFATGCLAGLSAALSLDTLSHS